MVRTADWRRPAIALERQVRAFDPWPVAEALIGGKAPDEYAASTGVSLATVRTQLRAIYDKTNTRSQAEAVGAMLWVLSKARNER